jgi:preprotein translocase subunit SecF
VQEALDAAGFEGYSLRAAGEKNFALRAATLTEMQRASLPEILSGGDAYRGVITQQTEVGPTIGAELRNKSLVAMAVVLLCILLFIAFAFRHVSEPVSSWTYGLIAIVTLLHDVIIPSGAFALFGYFWGAQVDTLFVTALLTILGFSIHDTIVVFDRTRENLRINHEKGRKEDFSITAGRSLNQTIVRSINTSVTVIISLATLYIFGPDSTKDFALTLLVGMVAGTYSSIFFATPLLVVWEKWRRNK